MKNILLVDDSPEIFTLVSHALQPIAQISWAETLEHARKITEAESFDLILLDLELPDGNGIELCTELQRKYPLISIFLLTAHTELSEKVLGFAAGADDYITKPFSPLELKARIEGKLKKTDYLISQSQNEKGWLRWKELHINQPSQEVFIVNNGSLSAAELTALEFKLLLYFAYRPHIVISRDNILNDIWGEDVHVYSRSVDTHVSKLRKKLGVAADLIESVHGVGYKFNPSVKNATH